MDLLALPSICAPKPVEQALKRARIEPPNPFAWDASPAAPEQELVSAMTAATVDAPSAPCPSPLAAPRALAVPTSRFSTGDGLSRQRSGDFARQSRVRRASRGPGAPTLPGHAILAALLSRKSASTSALCGSPLRAWSMGVEPGSPCHSPPCSDSIAA